MPNVPSGWSGRCGGALAARFASWQGHLAAALYPACAQSGSCQDADGARAHATSGWRRSQWVEIELPTRARVARLARATTSAGAGGCAHMSAWTKTSEVRHSDKEIQLTGQKRSFNPFPLNPPSEGGVGRT